jgi:hypothetical protein
MGHDLHGESSDYPAESQIAGFKQDPHFRLHHRRGVYELARRDSGSPALLHGLLSFAFNTVILALSVNIFSGLFVN